MSAVLACDRLGEAHSRLIREVTHPLWRLGVRLPYDRWRARFPQRFLHKTKRVRCREIAFFSLWSRGRPGRRLRLTDRYIMHSTHVGLLSTTAKVLLREGQKERGTLAHSLYVRWTYEKRMRDQKYRLSRRISGLMRQTLRKRGGAKGKRHWEALVGYTAQELRDHLEGLFLPGMTWANMQEWHIDHIRPIYSFSFTSHEDPEFRECWALSNLQPLWAADNLRKGPHPGPKSKGGDACGSVA